MLSILLLPVFCLSGEAKVSNVSNLLHKTGPLTVNSSAALRVHITQGHVKPSPIAFVDLYGRSDSEKKIGSKFLEVMRQDLCGCGSFSAINPASFIQTSQTLLPNLLPRMEDWRLIKAEFLICGFVAQHDNGYKVSIRVYDVFRGSNILAFSVLISNGNLEDHASWRRAAHMAADQIYTRITGEKGMFNTQFIYIEDLPPKQIKKQKVNHLCRLKIMDQDGANDRALTKGDNLVLTPRFSPDGKTVAYLAYKTIGHGKHRKPVAHVYLLDIETKQQRPLLTKAHFDAIAQANGGGQVNMTYAPHFSPDGKSICFALIINGKSAIYTMNILEGRIRRLTNHTAIDTSPDFSRDGKKIVFTSNRSGKEKIYIMNVDGSCVQRVTNGEGKYSQPNFSPRGDFIAFSKQVGNQFFIGVVRPNGREERLIVQSYLAESPSWSPNGRYIVFTRQASPKSPQKICMIDLTGYFMKEMNTNRNAFDCAWSPLLK